MPFTVHVSEQGNMFTYASLEAFEPFADGRAITIHGSALKCISTDTHAQFIAYSQATIESQLRTYFANANRDSDYTSQTGIFILDMEEPSDGVTKFAHPSDLHLASDAVKAEIIAAWKTRVDAARAVLPNASIALYGYPVSDGDGEYTATYNARLLALQTAGTSAGYNGVGSLYDSVDYICPILYPRFGPDDSASHWLTTEAYVTQGVTGGQSIRRSNGAPIPVAPLFTMRVANGNSANNDDQLLDIEPSLDRSLILPLSLARSLGITDPIFWVGNPDGETLPDPNPNGRTVTDYIQRLKDALMPTVTTDFATIRDNWITILEALTPTQASEYRFAREPGTEDFATQAQANPLALFRIFSLVDNTERETIGVSDFQVEQVTDTATLAVCYPHSFGLYGDENMRDLDSLISQDAKQIRLALGEFGASNYVSGQSLCRANHVIIREQDVSILIFTLTVTYYQSIS